MAERECYYTIFGPGSTFMPIKCETWEDVEDWFNTQAPLVSFEADEDDPDTWDLPYGWLIEYNDGSHMEPEMWEQLETHSRYYE